MFDPCGTRRVEGEDIIARLATYLGLDKDVLKEALLDLVDEHKDKISEEQNGGCPCGD